MITITELAQAHFRKLLAEHDEESTNIRVFVSNPGTPKAECGVSYCPDSAVERDDVTLAFEGFFAYVDAKSAPYLEEALIDYKTDEMGGQLTLKAPNAKARKVADDAPIAERVRYLVEAEINPQLANHGGHCTLIEVTDKGEAIFQFGGGCQGCGMIDVTLKDGIEQSLLEKFPNEITGVKDITEHAAGDNPYY